MKIYEQLECWTLRGKMNARTGGEKGWHVWSRLVQKTAEGKTSYELSWKVKMIKYIYIYTGIYNDIPRCFPLGKNYSNKGPRMRKNPRMKAALSFSWNAT